MRKTLLVAAALLALATLVYLLAGRRLAPARPLALTGTVEASEIDVAAQTTARVAALLVEEGDLVQRGQPVAQLDEDDAELGERRAEARLSIARASLDDLRSLPRREEVEAQRARVQEAEAPLPHLRAELSRAKQLLDSKSVTEARYDEVSNALAVGEQRVITAQRELAAVQAGPRPSQLEEARAKIDELSRELELAKVERARRRVLAPASGVVLRRNFEPGELATPGAALITLIDRSQLWVELAADEETQGRIQLGQAAQVTPESRPGAPPLTAHVSFIAERHGFAPRDVETRDERARLTYRVKVRLEQPPDSIKPGMFANVIFREAAPLAAESR